MRPAGSFTDGSDEIDLVDQVEFVARRHRHFDFLADLAADQRAAKRAVIADHADLGVRLGLVDDLVLHRLVVLVARSAARRVGKVCGVTCRSRLSPYHYKKKSSSKPYNK